jgi:hypothetical protein
MTKIVELERRRCLYPHCVLLAHYEVFGDDGGSEGEFCKRHAQTMVRRLERGEDVNLY